ncbi:DUF5677 domain-containing protein [Cupriavidus basilensis]|uniref:DUF5677 domain-containing protein n=1 Tax=Cupriavidus basilensis TaxID=68895 RepID=UPI001147362B|nr:DUF5677 domain-containing protein [Cupriavidus basilensis]
MNTENKSEHDLRTERMVSELVDGFHRLVQSAVGASIPKDTPECNDGHVLAIKVLKHVVTARYLMTTKILVAENYPFLDNSSVAVVARTALEGCLALHYAFCHPDLATRSFRYKMWRYSGLLERSKIVTSQDATKEKMAGALAQLDQLKAELMEFDAFKRLPPKKRSDVLGGNWRPQMAWIDLAVSAGISRLLFQQFYGYLCGHCHSSFISVLQTRDSMQSVALQQKTRLDAGSSACDRDGSRDRLLLRDRCSRRG